MTPVRVWRSDGQTATLVDGLRLVGVLDGEQQPTALDAGAWRPALPCDYCDHPAEVQLRPEQGDELLCACCSRSQFTVLGDWVRPIPRRVIRDLFPVCPALS